MKILPIEFDGDIHGMYPKGFASEACQREAVDWSREVGMQPMLSLCEALHGSNTGASDPYTEEDEAVIRRILNDRLRNWSKNTCPFDGHVRALIVAVLCEPSWDDRRWSYLYTGNDLPKPW